MPVRGSPWGNARKAGGRLGVRSPKGLLPLRGSKIHLRFPVVRGFYGWLCIALETGRAARRVTTFERKNRRSCPEGSEHRTSGLRMAPGDVAHVPRTPSPVAKAGPVAGHFRSRARLRRLLVRLRRPTPQRSLRSLRRRGFALYVRLRHYRSSLLAAASNSLTFVRGADRACCAPRKRQRGLISLLTDQSLPVPDAARPRRGIGVRTRQRHLAAAVLTALVVRRENGDSALFVRRVR